MNNKIDFIERATDYITFACKSCGKEVTIVSDAADLDDMQHDIELGANPFDDMWGDGNGYTVYCDCEVL